MCGKVRMARVNRPPPTYLYGRIGKCSGAGQFSYRIFRHGWNTDQTRIKLSKATDHEYTSENTNNLNHAHLPRVPLMDGPVLTFCFHLLRFYPLVQSVFNPWLIIFIGF